MENFQQELQNYLDDGSIIKAVCQKESTQHERKSVRLHRKVSPEHRIDLHGWSVDEAISLLSHEFTRLRKNLATIVLVITGKGLHCHNGQGVLKEAVSAWFTQCSFVAEFIEAPRKMGGSGAYLVRLKRSEKNI